jgi:hypothetical protein
MDVREPGGSKPRPVSFEPDRGMATGVNMRDRPIRCPICGEGELADIGYDAGLTQDDELQQQPSSRQLDVYTCGHEVPGAPLEAADERLDVERRTSDEAAQPVPGRDADQA